MANQQVVLQIGDFIVFLKNFAIIHLFCYLVDERTNYDIFRLQNCKPCRRRCSIALKPSACNRDVFYKIH